MPMRALWVNRKVENTDSSSTSPVSASLEQYFAQAFGRRRGGAAAGQRRIDEAVEPVGIRNRQPIARRPSGAQRQQRQQHGRPDAAHGLRAGDSGRTRDRAPEIGAHAIDHEIGAAGQALQIGQQVVIERDVARHGQRATATRNRASAGGSARPGPDCGCRRAARRGPPALPARASSPRAPGGIRDSSSCGSAIRSAPAA